MHPPLSGRVRRSLLCADILAEEWQDLVGTLDTGEDGRAVAMAQLLRGQVGADDGGPAGEHTAVDDLIEGALDKGGGHLGAQVIQDQQVAALTAADVGIADLVGAELGVLIAGENADSGVVDHGEAGVADLPGDAGGEERLAQAGAAGEQQAAAAPGELAGKVPADVEVALHVGPGRNAVAVPHGAVVQVEAEGVEPGLAQRQEPGELRQLLAGVVLLQAGADAGPGIAGVSAEGAGRLVLQVVGGIAHVLQQGGALALQGEIFVPQDPQGGQRVLALFGGGGHDAAHGGAEGAVDVPQAGLAGKDLPAALVQLGLPALAGLVKAGNGPLHDDTVV